MFVFIKDCLIDYVLYLVGGGNNVLFGILGGNGIF